MMSEEEKETIKQRFLKGEREINVRELPESLRSEVFDLLKECGIDEDEVIVDWLYFDVWALIETGGKLRYSLSVGSLEEKIKEVDRSFDLDNFWEWVEKKDKRYWKFFKLLLFD